MLLKYACFSSHKTQVILTSLAENYCETKEMSVWCVDDAQIVMVTTGHSFKAEQMFLYT